MSNLHEQQIVNILGHSAGTIIFGIFLYLLGDRSGTRLRGSWLSVTAAGLAFLWNIGSLSVFIASSNNSQYTNLVVFFSFSVLSLLPAILLQLSLEGLYRPVIVLGYGLSGIAVLMRLRELLAPGQYYQQQALLLITVGFAILTLLSVGGCCLAARASGKPGRPAYSARCAPACLRCRSSISAPISPCTLGPANWSFTMPAFLSHCSSCCRITVS